MTDQDKSPTTRHAIDVGIYGCTKAGKTRFLYEIINHWKRTGRLVDQSTCCKEFLKTVRSAIKKSGGSLPTVATTQGIGVKVRRDGNDPPLQLVFRDLRGELLSAELDQIDSLERNGIIPTQVRQCDAFLFFFDPTSSENPADIDKHHQRELRRATGFIEYVLPNRQNRHLPIIFVLTHLDKWENDEKIRGEADRWIDEVHARLNEVYKGTLRGEHPKTIVDRSRTFFMISSVRDTLEARKRLEEVVDQLIEMVTHCKSHQRWLQKRGLCYLIAAMVFVIALVLVICLFWSSGRPPGPRQAHDRIVVAELSEQEILTKLDDLDRVLKAHPPGEQLPSVEEARKVNHHLRWLAQRFEPDSGGTTGLSEKTIQRMRSALESLAKLIQAKAGSVSSSPSVLTPILAAYLEDLPDLASTSPVLAAAQARYWQVQRAQVVEQVASIIKRRHAVDSPPIDTLGELASKLRGIETDVGRCKVFGPQARQHLAQQIQTAATFCEDRIKSHSYPFVFRLVSAYDSSKKQADLAFRNLRIVSPKRTDWLTEDGVALVPNDEGIPVDISVTIHWGPKCRNGYRNSVKVQIGGVELWDVEATSTPNDRSELGIRRVTAKRSDKLFFKAHIRITDGTFVFSSREHGKGEHTVTLGTLLDEKQVFELDRDKNKVVITARRASGDEPNAFHTKEPKYHGELGLGMPVTCILSVHDRKEGKWHKLHEFELTTDPGPLTPLGLPLLRRDQPKVVKVLRGNGMELKMEFFGFPRVPPLIWDATAGGKERKP